MAASPGPRFGLHLVAISKKLHYQSSLRRLSEYAEARLRPRNKRGCPERFGFGVCCSLLSFRYFVLFRGNLYHDWHFGYTKSRCRTRSSNFNIFTTNFYAP